MEFLDLGRLASDMIPVEVERPDIPGSRQMIYVTHGYDLQGLRQCGWVFPRVERAEVASWAK